MEICATAEPPLPPSVVPAAKEAGPVDVIESRGVRIPIYLNPRRGKESYLVIYFAKGKRKRVSNLTDARKRAKAIIDAVEILSPLHLSITDVARQYAQAHKILDGRPLMEAVDFYAKHLAREALHGALSPVTLPDLVKNI